MFSPEILRIRSDKHVQTSVSSFWVPRPQKQPTKWFCKAVRKKTSACQCVKQRCYCVFASWTPFLCLELDTAQNTLCLAPAKILRRTAITWCSWTLRTTEGGTEKLKSQRRQKERARKMAQVHCMVCWRYHEANSLTQLSFEKSNNKAPSALKHTC